MKLLKAEISYVRSIYLNCLLDFHKKTNVLIGKSNVGKSNILKAINYAFTDKPISKKDICSWSTVSPKDDCVKLTFTIEKKDKVLLEKINKELGLKKEITLIKRIDGSRNIQFSPPSKYKTFYVPTNEFKEVLTKIRARSRKALRRLNALSNKYEFSEQLQISYDSLLHFINVEKKLIPQKDYETQEKCFKEFSTKITNIRKLLNDKNFKTSDFTGIKMSFSYICKDSFTLASKIDFIEKKSLPFSFNDILKLLPEIIFVEAKDEFKIADKIQVDKIINNTGNEFMLKILEISGIDVNIFSRNNRREITSKIKTANEKLAETISNYWSQEELTIEIQHTTDIIDNKSVQFIELDFIGEEQHRGSIFDQSIGFRWFFAFVIKHLSFIKDNKDLLLVLDEPALHLHASAQNDLLDRFDKTSSNLQIIYTTHSPFLINKNYPFRIKCVLKGNGSDNKQGTFINNKPYHSQKSRAWEPIRSSIGLSSGMSLFVASNNLIVEGISDVVYLSVAAQVINEKEDKPKYNLNNISICYASTSANIISLSLFCNQESSSCKVLLDGDNGGKNVKQLLIKNKFPKEKIILISDTSKEQLDIENLFSDEFYHNCFLEAYKAIPKFNHTSLPKTFTDIKKVNDNSTQTSDWGKSKFYSEYFKKHKDEIGRFDKVLVSQYISDHILSLDDSERIKVIKPFENLLSKIWSASDKW